jgi:hypothetical protein
VLQSTEQCSATLGMLQKHFGIARHVRELVIRPHAKYHNHFNRFDNATVSSIVRQVAGAKVADAMCLDALVKFQWDAEEMPFFEDMWFALRLGCVSRTMLTLMAYDLINPRNAMQVSAIALYRHFDWVISSQSPKPC